MSRKMKFDEIGYWSEIKLDIIKRYATEYSKILRKQGGFRYYYIDAFSGAGWHLRKETVEMVQGSPLNALDVTPPFDGYWFIDLDNDKIKFLKTEVGSRQDVEFFAGDCNEVLLKSLIPRVAYESYSRALCLVDPYGLHLDWRVLKAAGARRTIEIFLNFPVADINRNVLWRNPEHVDPRDIGRMTRFWGDETWRQIAYTTGGNLFGWEEKISDNTAITKAYQRRLIDVAAFQYVPDPLPMRNNEGAVVYYLFFASPNKVANKIVQHIFDKYRERGVRK